MCEPARKLIRLTSLTEFTMSEGAACNGGLLRIRPSICRGMKSTPCAKRARRGRYGGMGHVGRP